MDAERMARVERLLDRHDILDCLVRFSRGMDRFDQDPGPLRGNYP
jgi:hypothetical protein